MTLEISLRSPFTLPRVLRAQKDGARQHWVGQTSQPSQKKAEQGKQEGEPRREGGDNGYRPLADIKLGEVEDAFNWFEHQLIPAGENWIGKNCFCSIPLKHIRDGRPPMIFGRVKSCFPSDGHIDNVEDVELLFPHKGAAPDKVRIYKDDISQYSQRTAQSYYVQVRVKASEDDKVDFAEAAPLLSAKGFYPEFDAGYYDILEMNEQNQSAYPWLFVVGSRWFDSIPESIHLEVKAKLREMLQWGKQIFNYHPDWLPNEINTLNKVLGLKYEFTTTVLTEPASPKETAFIVSKIFDRDIFPTGRTAK